LLSRIPFTRSVEGVSSFRRGSIIGVKIE
jgi:hypothetical protein